MMRGFKPVGLAERQNAAISARKQALEHFRSKAAANDQSFSERQEALKAVRLGRETRAAARQVLRDARETETAALAAREHETALAAERDDAVRADRERTEQAVRETKLAAEQKAARDARYAARKARQ